MNRRLLLLTPLSLLLTRSALAQTVTLGPIEITHPWTEPSVTEAAAVFVELNNLGPRPDRLIGGGTPIAERVILRDRDGGALDYYDLLPRRPVRLRPGRRYIALRGLKRLLAIDDTFPLTLQFAEAGSIELTVAVEQGQEN